MTLEHSPEGELSPEWQELVKEGIQSSLENYELIFQPSEGQDYSTPLNFSPITLTEGADEREYHELSPQERAYIKKNFFHELGIEDEPEKIGEYEVAAPEGQDWEGVAKVNIYNTARVDENMFLHELNRPDNTQEYIVAPQDYRL